MASIEELWRQVSEHPADLAPRLVLADALLEAGDPRGDLFVLQCRGADASVIVSSADQQASAAELVNELVASHWDAWLGEVAPLIERQGSRFRDGMLWAILVGSDARVRDELWATAGRHHELAAVEEVRPRRVKPDQYARFLASLVHDPRCVELRHGVAMALVRYRKRWSVREAWYPGFVFFEDTFDAELGSLAHLAPGLEELHFTTPGFTSERADDVIALIKSLPRRFASLRAIRIEGATGSYPRFDEQQAAELRTVPQIELLD